MLKRGAGCSQLYLALITCVAISTVMLAIKTSVLSTRIPAARQQCSLPPAGRYKAWDNGIVTQLTPQVHPNCSRILHGDEEEIKAVNETMSSWTNAISDANMKEKIGNCSWLKESFTDNFYVSELEKSFPLAFSFVVHDSPQQVLRLLRVLYRPHNTYCIHYDAKSSHAEFFEGIAACFENVVVPAVSVDVTWGHFSVLGAQMQCMTTLYMHRFHWPPQLHWKYLLNLCGKELPLVTNKEIVARLFKLNGTSSLIPRKVSLSEDIDRIKFLVKLNRQGVVFQDKSMHLNAPPFNLTQYYKSQGYVALSHQFVEYLLTNRRSMEIHSFFKKCKNPEEHFYATMFMLPGVPGGYREALRGKYFVMESVDWSNAANNRTCSGSKRNHICITTARDLQRVLEYSSAHLFHNKYVMNYDHVVMMCMEEVLAQENMMEYLQDCRDGLTRS